MTLLELAERCEKSTVPDRELDAAIAGFLSNSVESDDGDFWWGPHDEPPIRVPDFTASLDAAMTLVPVGWFLQGLSERNASGTQNWRWKAELWSPDSDANVRGIARQAHADKCAPAIALCAAALKSRAPQCVPNTPEGDG